MKEKQEQVLNSHSQGRSNRGITKKYTIENLDCAHCGAKIEKLIGEMDGIEDVSLSYPLKQLRITAEAPDAVLPKVISLARTVEDGFDLKEIGGTKKQEEEEESNHLFTLIGGAVLYAAAVIYKLASGSHDTDLIQIVLTVCAYLLLGGGVLWTAAKNISKGKVFDENFLMSIATLGAFVIGEYYEAVGVMLFFRIGELFEDVAVKRSRSRIMEAVDLRPETVNLVSGDSVKVIGAEEAMVGDVLLVRPGERIPLDGTVVDGESRIDTSAVTGEPVPVRVQQGDRVMSGCVNNTGAIRLRVDNELKDSMVSRILESVENAAAGKPKIDNFITKFARIYTPIVVAAALFTAVVIPLLTDGDFYRWVYTALSFLVMSCPCALVLSVPLAYFCGIGSASKSGILFKGGIVMEALAKIKAVVMDKTGTITVGDFSVRKVFCSGGMTEEQVLSLCGSCEIASTHPIGQSIVAECEKRGLKLETPDKIQEISGKGIIAETGGRQLLVGNRTLMEENGIDISEWGAVNSGTEVLLAADGEYKGSIIISDTVKSGALDAVKEMKSLGIKTAILTGDGEAAAKYVAAEVGIDEAYGGLLPENKVEKLREIRSKYGEVMFVGDGINDAPVLAGADVGAAMGSGADAAIEVADVVFMNSDLGAVTKAVSVSGATAAIAKENVIFALAVKFIAILLGITGIYTNMWLAVFADTGVAFLCILNSVRLLYKK